MAPVSPPDDPVRGLVPCFIPPWMLQSGASFYRIRSVASDAPVRGTRFTPGRSSPGASAVLHSAPDAPIRGVFLWYSPRCIVCSSPWHRVHPRAIQSGGSGRAPRRPGCSDPGCHVSFSLCCLQCSVFRSRQGYGTLLGAHTSIRTAAVALWGLRGLDLFLAACSSSGVAVCRGGVVLCAVVRAGVWCCVCAPPGLCVARAPCPGVLLRRRGDTPSLWRARLAPWRALLAPGCGPARGSGACVRWGGGGWVPLPSPSAPCPSVPFRQPALPAYPLRSRWVGLGWTVGLGGLSWCFFPAGRRGLGSFWGRVARAECRAACKVSWASWLMFTGVHALCVVLRVRCPGLRGSCSPVCALCVWCCVYGVLGLLAPVDRRARPVCGVACTVSWASWLLFTGLRAVCVVLCARCPGSLLSCLPVCTLCVWCCVYGVLGLLAPVHRCARSVCGVVCTVSWASWLLFTGVQGLCVVLRVRCPGPPGSCSPVCTLCVWCCVYGVLGLPAPVHRCARPVCGVVGAVSWAAWLLFTGVHGLCAELCARCPGLLGSCAPSCLLWCAVSRVRCPGPLGSGSPVCTLCVRCRVRGLLGLLAPFCWCDCVVCVVLRVWCPGTLGSCSPVLRCAVMCVVFGVRCCVCGVLGRLAPVHRCARSVCGVSCTVSWASWLLFTGVHALCVVLRVRCPGPPGSCSPMCALCVWCCVHVVLGCLAPVHRCAHSVCGVVCTVSWASWLLFTGVHASCVVLCVRCPGPPGSCSPVCTLCVWCCVFGVLGLLAPVHPCVRSVCGFACTVSRASWLLFTGVHALCVVLRVRCSGPPGSCSPACTFYVWCCVYGVLGLPAPVHRCARPVCGVVRAVSWAAWLLFTGVHALCAVLCARCPGLLGSCAPVCLIWCAVSCVRCPGPLGSGSTVCTLCVRCRVRGLLGLLAPFCWCARVVCVVLRVWCPGTPGSCSLLLRCAEVCVVFGVRCCVCGVMGLPAPVHRCAPPVCGVVWAVSWAAWLLFTSVLVWCFAWYVWCPGPLGSQSPVCLCCVLRGVCGVPGHLAPVHRCARVACVLLRVRCPGPRGSCSPACCVLCSVSPAMWLLFTGVLALCVARCVWCGFGCVIACAIPPSLPFLSRPGVGAVGVFMAQTPWGMPQRTCHWHSGLQGVRHPTQSYLFLPSWTLCFWRRPRVTVSYCMHGGVCYLLVGLCTLCILRRRRVGVFV